MEFERPSKTFQDAVSQASQSLRDLSELYIVAEDRAYGNSNALGPGQLLRCGCCAALEGQRRTQQQE